jgi:curved DNA-binding protein
MSAPSAGKFQDHYEVLGIEPQSDSDGIQRAYARLAQRFHPANPDTGDKEKFDAVNQAYEVLSDSQLRKDFDAVKGVSREETGPKFSGIEFFDALKRGTGLRSAILAMLYDRRRMNPFKPSITNRHSENMLNVTTEELTFALWYLKQRNLVASDDKSALQITVDGMDLLENNQPLPEVVMPFFKPTALAAVKIEAPAVQSPVQPISEPIANPTPSRFGQLGRPKNGTAVA